MTMQYNMRPVNDRVTSLRSSLGTPHIYAMMNSIHHYFVNKSSSMFDTESDPFNNKWKPLSEATLNWRRSLGFGPRPINYRTGTLRNYVTSSRADILGHSDGVVSYAFPRRAMPSKEVRWRLEQASGLIRGGPARRVIGMSEADIAATLGIVHRGIVEGI